MKPRAPAKPSSRLLTTSLKIPNLNACFWATPSPEKTRTDASLNPSGWISVDPDSSEQWETRGGPAKGLGCCVFFDGRKSPAITEPGGERKYPFLINQRQIDDALAYHGTTEHPRFWSQSIGFWPPAGITQTVLDERIVLNNHLRESATWYTDFQQWAVLDPSYEGGDRKVFLPFTTR